MTSRTITVVAAITVAAGLMGSAASAGNLKFFLGRPQEVDVLDPYDTFVPDIDQYECPYLLSVGETVTFGLWAQVHVHWDEYCADMWRQIAVDFRIEGYVLPARRALAGPGLQHRRFT